MTTGGRAVSRALLGGIGAIAVALVVGAQLRNAPVAEDEAPFPPPSVVRPREPVAPTPPPGEFAPVGLSPRDELRMQASALARSGKLDEAIALLDGWVSTHAADPIAGCDLAALFDTRAVRLFNAADLKGAEAGSARAIALCPRGGSIRENRARILLARSREAATPREQRAMLEESIELEDGVSGRVALGELTYANNELREAVGHYQRAVELAPENKLIKARADELRRNMLVESNFNNVRQGHFVARFDGYAHEALGARALEVLERAYITVGDALSLHPVEPITVVIYTGDQYSRATSTPDWSSGAFDGKIRVREGDLQAQSGHLEDILVHEYVHAVLRACVRGDVPSWFNEGLAQHLEPTLRPDATAALRAARDDGQLQPLSRMGASFVGIESAAVARLAYLQARAVVGALAARGGSASLGRLLALMNQGRSFDAAFLEVYGLTVAAFDARWRGAL